MPKKLKFVGSSKDDLSAFPADAKWKAGYQLFRVQEGLNPDNWKPMATVGRGVREIIVRADDGAYRVFYVASFATAVYVLHAFQKTTEQTEQRDIELGKKRYKAVRDIERTRKDH